MKKKASSYIGLLLPIILGAGLTYYTYNSFSAAQILQMKSYFKTANYNYVLLSLLVAVIGSALRAYRWKYTLQEIRIKPHFKLNFFAVCIGYFINLTIPRSGEVSRALLLKKYQDAPFDKVFGTIIAERIIDLIFLLLFVITALFLEFSTLKNFLLTYIPLYKLLVIAIVGIVVLLSFVWLYQYAKWPFIQLFKTKINGLKEGVLSILKMENKWKFLFFTILIWLSYIFMFYITVFSLQATKNIAFGTIIVAFVMGGLTMSFTNGGFGFFPVLIAKILFLYQIPLEVGNAFGWIIWTSQLIITIILGILSFLMLPTQARAIP